MTLAREKWFSSGFNGFTCLWTSSHYFAVCPAAKRGLQICLREVAQSLSLKPKEVGDCIQCVLARISHAVVALFKLQPTIKEGGGGALNPCGFVGYDLPCVQVTGPLLPKQMLCYLFTHELHPILRSKDFLLTVCQLRLNQGLQISPCVWGRVICRFGEELCWQDQHRCG